MSLQLDLGEQPIRTEVIASTRKRPILWSHANFSDWWACYAEKLEGATEAAEEGEGIVHACFSFLGCFLCTSLLGILQEHLMRGLSNVNQVPLVRSTPAWGASAIQVFSTWYSPGAQPKNVILGNLIGAVAAVLVHGVPFPDLLKVPKVAFAVSFTLAVQETSGAVHPAGAATAMLLAMADEVTWYSLTSTVGGSVLMVLVAVLFNNLSIERFYPQSWWSFVRPDGPPGRRLPPPSSYMMDAPEQWLKVYLEKLRGGDALGPLQISSAHSCFSALASFIFLMSMIFFNNALGFDSSRLAAVAVASSLFFSDWKGATSQPWQCLIGSLLAALCGSLCSVLPQLGIELPLWFSAALAVALTSFTMELSYAIFPAGGAIAIACVAIPAQIPWVSVLYTGFLSPSLVIIYGTFINNLQENRLYPRRWPWQEGIARPASNDPVQRYTSQRNLVRL